MPPDVTIYLVYGLVGAFTVFSLLWVIQVIRRDAGVVDIGWTGGVGAMAIVLAVAGAGWWPRRVLMACLAGTWALRLCYYILKDRVLPGQEDRRYQRMRAYWGRKADARFFAFFTSQSLLVVLFALPFIPIAWAERAAFAPWDIAGAALWLIALTGEVIADRQLARFRADPANAGTTCQHGLWRYSRHPNYFFEWLHWWAYALIAWPLAYGYLGLVGPVFMFLFLMFLTGIPYAEKQAMASRPDYADYKRRTSMFIPLPPRRMAHDR